MSSIASLGALAGLLSRQQPPPFPNSIFGPFAPGASGASGGFASDPLLSATDSDGDSDGSSGGLSTAFGAGTPGSVSPSMLAALLGVQEQSSKTGAGSSVSGTAQGTSFADRLFAQIDTNGDGQIGKSELEAAFGLNNESASTADAVFAKLDTNGDGSVSPSELKAGLHQAASLLHHHGGGMSSARLASMLQNASQAGNVTSNVVTNADGSTTTTVTYPDGTKFTMTTPAAAAQDTTSL